ncbi:MULTISPECIES: trehalose-phosphatase [unclassified Roseitalea]|uniref:trehalose-phosphatase n=1 Tax=unclassified Roseitalea TaxID=2639107 RepID=UPI00273D6A24|nr:MULTISPECIES: trehalose-phosphatase [unclassified Roseitalea]
MLDYYALTGFSHEGDIPTPLEMLEMNLAETALFLDFDGTVVDIADRPDAIEISDDDKGLLERASRATGGALAMVSGRSIDDLERYIDGVPCALAGGHGVEFRFTDGQRETARFNRDNLERLRSAAEAFAQAEPRIFIEHKTAGIVLHFRQHPEMEDKARTFAEAMVLDDPESEVQPGKMVFEIKPKAVSKARAIERLMETPPFAGRRILFAGDDHTDELAFGALRQKGAICVKIGEEQTKAEYASPSPEAFKAWLTDAVERTPNG